MIQTIENALYSYDPNQYMPIYQDGELANRSAFIAYKLKRTAIHLGHAAGKAVQFTQAAVEAVGDTIE